MNRTLIPAVIVILALAALGVWQLQQKAALQAELDILRGSHERWGLETQQQINQLNRTIAALRQQLQQATGRPAAPDAATGPEAAAAGMAMPDMATAAPGSALRTVASQVLASPDARSALAQTALTSQYGELLRLLQLSPEKEKALKERLLAVIEAQLLQQQKFASGQITREALADGNNRQQIDAIMADTLDRKQLETYRAYEADRPVRARAQLEAVTSMQLATQAPGLTDANRALVASTIANAMTNPQRARTAAGPPDQSAVMDDVETSLQGTLPDDQMKIVRDYLRQRERLNNILRQ